MRKAVAGFSAREGSGVFSTCPALVGDDRDGDVSAPVRALGSFLLAAGIALAIAFLSFSAREGSGVFSTVPVIGFLARRFWCVSAPVRALGSFLRDVWRSSASRHQSLACVSAPVRALGSFLLLLALFDILLYTGRFSAREGSGVFSTPTTTTRSSRVTPRFSAREGSGVFSTRQEARSGSARVWCFSAREGSGVFSTSATLGLSLLALAFQRP